MRAVPTRAGREGGKWENSTLTPPAQAASRKRLIRRQRDGVAGIEDLVGLDPGLEHVLRLEPGDLAPDIGEIDAPLGIDIGDAEAELRLGLAGIFLSLIHISEP